MDLCINKELFAHEQEVSNMSQTEKEIFFIREDYRNGKINKEQLEDAIDCLLFWAESDGKISPEESERLYNKYA